jgi:hypothetical protein
MRSLAIAVVLVGAATAHANVDWAKGLVTADGIGVANRAAPTPAAARGPARRMAEEAARKKLVGLVGAVPIAAGGTVAAKMKDATVKAAVEKTIAHALVVAAELETDGSWKVTMGVPLEALRQATLGGGPRTLSGGDDGADVVIVDGAGATKPALGYAIGGITGAVVFAKDVPAWAKDAPRVKAKGAAKAGAIDAAVGTVEASEGTLFVIQTK